MKLDLGLWRAKARAASAFSVGARRPNPQRRCSIGRLFVLGLIAVGFAWIYIGSCCAAADESRPSETSTTERDFRAKPFRFRREIEKQNLTPLVDRKMLSARLMRLLTSVGPWKPSGYLALRPRRKLSFHVVIRYEAPREKDGFVDVHIPPATGLSAKIPPSDEAPYHGLLSDAVKRIAELGGLSPESDAASADLLIHVNLAERLQTSTGFTYETMPRFPNRGVQPAPHADLEMMELALPWSFARLYYYWQGDYDERTEKGRSIEGGEIWIQYPKRAFWQAEIARIALDDPDYRARHNLGANRDSIVSRFRTPHRIELQPVKEALSPLTRQVWFGAGGAADLEKGTAPRPKETLLSLAMTAMQPSVGTIYELGGPASPYGHCGDQAHAQTLAGRLARSMVIFVAGIEAGALRIAPLGDYTSQFKSDPDALLADLSLAGYQGSFDQRLDDRLVMMGLEEMRAAHAEGHQLAERESALSMFDRRIDDIRNAIRETALGFTSGGGGCVELVEFE